MDKNRQPDVTPAETPRAKARLSLYQTVRLVDVLEEFAKQISELNRQNTYFIIKHDEGIPSVYNKIANEKMKQINLYLEEFKSSLNEDEDRPSQSIIVNVTSKKSEKPPSIFSKAISAKVTYIVSAIVAIISGLYLGLKESGILK